MAEYLQRVSHREHKMWLRFLDDDYNHPSRTDWYIMRLCTVVDGLFRSNVDIDSYKLKWQLQRQRRRRPETLAQMKLRWFSMIGMEPPPGALD